MNYPSVDSSRFSCTHTHDSLASTVIISHFFPAPAVSVRFHRMRFSECIRTRGLPRITVLIGSETISPLTIEQDCSHVVGDTTISHWLICSKSDAALAEPYRRWDEREGNYRENTQWIVGSLIILSRTPMLKDERFSVLWREREGKFRDLTSLCTYFPSCFLLLRSTTFHSSSVKPMKNYVASRMTHSWLSTRVLSST
jgi:hypothetical protein